MKHEYCVLITYTEVHSVYVEADNEDEAIELAESMYANGETELYSERHETKVDWSDEEPEERILDEED